eukprot:Skav208183  [mRNA]  locus=scaffold2530:283201:283656:- [translate_table: standard]
MDAASPSFDQAVRIIQSEWTNLSENKAVTRHFTEFDTLEPNKTVPHFPDHGHRPYFPWISKGYSPSMSCQASATKGFLTWKTSSPRREANLSEVEASDGLVKPSSAIVVLVVVEAWRGQCAAAGGPPAMAGHDRIFVWWKSNGGFLLRGGE